MGLEARGDDSGKHEVYSDSDCASHRVDKKTIFGSALMFDRGPNSQLQYRGHRRNEEALRVATSSRCESEHMTMPICAKKGQWVFQLLSVVTSPWMLKDDMMGCNLQLASESSASRRKRRILGYICGANCFFPARG